MSHSKPPYRVVITGYGAVTPLGDSAAESWQAIMDYRRGYRYVDLSANGIHTHFIGQVENEPSLKGFPPHSSASAASRSPGAGRRAGGGGDGLCW
ncbi:3-oxoacyl-ACP synthase [Klebsiella grimontii]|uniref:3-oxoacyl-ACP synthase n=1 Tax=Klebsiella grimontii TaxID=2058152 RepID=A0A7H4NY12_9ENTR|nr:3-oxoacyl-ACP synthase [Klebsiella grimontii]